MNMKGGGRIPYTDNYEHMNILLMVIVNNLSYKPVTRCSRMLCILPHLSRHINDEYATQSCRNGS